MGTPAMPVLIPKGIFINQADTFISSHIAKALSNAVFGVKKSKGKEEEEEEMDEDGGKSKAPEGFANNLFCTTTNGKNKTNFPATLLEQDENWVQLYSKIKECELFVYNIVDDDRQVEEALWVANKLHDEMDTFQKRKIFVLISTVLTWVATKPLPNDDPEAPFTDEDYRRRLAHPNYLAHLAAEKEIKRLGTTQVAFDHLTVNLALESVFAHESFHFKWVCDGGFVESIKTMVKEFKLARGLIVSRGQKCVFLTFFIEHRLPLTF
ncbi:unnamed protein product [Dibothriocephalus latus]|uniref:Uncharacterized protein n=1 Tax=Dibothriocephalus latus TaxID=60516 RepID=A0A3P7LHV9_DIBLA|nr:unnamed protein product [Dibothriocephalus latus]